MAEHDYDALRERLDRFENTIYGPKGNNGLVWDSRECMIALFGNQRSGEPGLVQDLRQMLKVQSTNNRMILLLTLAITAHITLPNTDISTMIQQMISTLLGLLA